MLKMLVALVEKHGEDWQAIADDMPRGADGLLTSEMMDELMLACIVIPGSPPPPVKKLMDAYHDAYCPVHGSKVAGTDTTVGRMLH